MSLLEIKNLNVSYGRLQVLWDININLGERSIIGIIGPNGAGKTTLLKTIAGVIKPATGQIIYKGHDISRLPASSRVKLGIVYVPDYSSIFGKMSVSENILLGAFLKRDRLEERLKLIYELFPILYERRNQVAETLSGGEKQMLVIARALMSNPEVLLMDEPSTGLSPIAAQKVYSAIKELISSYDVSIVLVEQFINRVLQISDYVYLIESGRIRAEGSPSEFSQLETVRRFYVGL